MAKGGSSKMDWSGLPDARPCSSTNSQSKDYVPSSGSVGDYKGVEDQRPSSSTTSQSVNVGSGKG